MLIGDICRLNGRRYPNKKAVIFGDRDLTWAALDERANRLGSYLLSRGLQPGDRIAVVARNTLEWPEVIFGLAKAGLAVVPINIRLASGEANYMLEDAGCRAAIVHTDQTAAFGDVVDALDLVMQIGGADLGANYEDALQEGRPVDPTPQELKPNDIHFLLYTSGTTGRPKAVVNEYRGMIAQVLDTTIVTEARHDDVLLAITPFFTAGGMVRTLAWLYLGQTVIIHPRFDPEATLAAIEGQRVTMTTFIPTMLLRTLQQLEAGPPRDVSSLRRISYGSAPSNPGLAREAMDRLGCDLQQRYGLTEAGGQVTILTPEDHRAMVAGKAHLVGSCGRETPMAEIRIVGNDGEELPPGENGEIVIRAESVARGYWNRPVESEATFRPNGLWSGDLGRLDEEGYLYIAGRKTDMIISGGFNVYPAELERVIGADPDVDLVAVVGAPHPEWGETPVAVIVPRLGANVSGLEQRLRARCRSELAGYKQPRLFEFRTELPLGPAGKIVKREIKVSRLESESSRGSGQ
jgi:acyl-CoA synthetase (AMP-forming)/AMP-acid ligase II